MSQHSGSSLEAFRWISLQMQCNVRRFYKRNKLHTINTIRYSKMLQQEQKVRVEER